MDIKFGKLVLHKNNFVLWCGHLNKNNLNRSATTYSARVEYCLSGAVFVSVTEYCSPVSTVRRIQLLFKMRSCFRGALWFLSKIAPHLHDREIIMLQIDNNNIYIIIRLFYVNLRLSVEFNYVLTKLLVSKVHPAACLNFLIVSPSIIFCLCDCLTVRSW